MKKLILAALAALFAAVAAPAMALNCSTFPYTLTNGTTADANQVMANLNLLLNCANQNLAHNAANSDITSLSALSTPLSRSQGGTGYTTGVPIDVNASLGGLTGNTWTLLTYQPSTALALSTALSRCTAGTAPTGSPVYTLKQNGASIGTATFAAGLTTCTAAITASPVSISAGDILTVVGPATGDATLADIGITFGGVRQ